MLLPKKPQLFTHNIGASGVWTVSSDSFFQLSCAIATDRCEARRRRDFSPPRSSLS
uniref:Uncharacterized protein n=1 Tax=Oryza brachyantha TaxID=4533 RepID=J3MIV4_ORYBR